MKDKILPAVQLIGIVIVGLFIAKTVFAWIYAKVPNKVTQAVNTVVQSV